MKITAISDLHGHLPKIEKTDLLIIAGDWSPLEIQRDLPYMHQWMVEFFFPYLQEVPAEKIVFIAGNHDFVCDDEYNFYDLLFHTKQSFKKHFFRTQLKKFKLEEKVRYLENSYTLYNRVKIYGCPYVFGCDGWAFANAQTRMSYEGIPKCDILVTHQPPRYNGIATTEIKYSGCLIKKDFGSTVLMDRILEIKPKLVFCGHIHSGDHTPQIITHADNTETKLYNCSLKNEEYNVAFKPQIVEYELNIE